MKAKEDFIFGLKVQRDTVNNGRRGMPTVSGNWATTSYQHIKST